MPDITLKSFGFKYGNPNANNYIDVSSLKNPAREEKFALADEPTDEMYSFLLQQPLAQDLLDVCIHLARVLISLKDKPVLAFGCSGGRHRSWIFAELVGESLRKLGYSVNIIHETPEGEIK